MLPWNHSFADKPRTEDEQAVVIRSEPWKGWHQPPSGFVELRCGGLLPHVLVSQGYAGHGFDIRARTAEQDTVDVATVAALGDVGCARAGVKVFSLKPFNPIDKRKELMYREESTGKLKRVRRV